MIMKDIYIFIYKKGDDIFIVDIDRIEYHDLAEITQRHCLNNVHDARTIKYFKVSTHRHAIISKCRFRCCVNN